MRGTLSTLPWNMAQVWQGGSSSVNDSGEIGVTSSGNSAIDYVVRGEQAGTGAWTVLETDGIGLSGIPGATFVRFSSATITADGRVGFVANSTGAASGADPIARFDGQHHAYKARVSNGLAWIVDGAPRVQTNQILPGSGYTRRVSDVVAGRTRCLGGTVGRQVGGVILQAGPSGQVTAPANLAMLPTPLGPVAAMLREEWNFGYWYRDANPSVTSNFSSGISIRLQ